MQNKVDKGLKMIAATADSHPLNEQSSQEISTDVYWMGLALQHAKEAALQGEVPVGAALVGKAGLLAAAGNSPIGLADPTAHAEILAIRSAAHLLQNYRLSETTLYVTLEPCIMCMGALIQARISRLVYGAADLKTGAATSVYAIGSDQRLNHSLTVTGGVLADQCAELLKNFFKERRSGIHEINSPILKFP
jgi:tRNA(adenine34) deaminase